MYGIDCSTRLNPTTAQALKNSGVMTIGRYLGYKLGLWNSITPDEVKAIHDAGMSIFLIFELNPTSVSYFNYEKGLSDAKQAIAEAEFLGVPRGLAIYFTVDYDAQPGDMSSIIDYLQGVRDGLGGKYLLGIYGSYTVIKSVQADRYYQTYAWSGGQTAPNHIMQYKNDVSLAGIKVDQDYVNDDAGLWFKQTVVAPVVTPVAPVVEDKDIYLSVRVLQSKADQAIRDINKLGFAAKKMDLA